MQNRQNRKGAGVYLYIRTPKCSEEKTLDLVIQARETLYAYVKENELKIMGEYIDLGVSGWNIDERPMFKQMIKDIENGKDDVKFVVVSRMEQFGRNMKDVLKAIEAMNSKGVCLLGVKDRLDTSAGFDTVMEQ